MGNGSSQSIVLTPSRYPQAASYPLRNGYADQHRGLPKYVHPQNRVLPLPVSGQRLRSTDNGNILQTAGTIRGLKRDSPVREELVDRETMGPDTLDNDDNFYHHHQMNMRNHRLFQSDPNIARRPVHGGYYPQDVEKCGNRRNSGGGAANKTNKYKKKSPAPQPPPTGNSLPRHLERRGNYQEDVRNRNNQACKCVGKSKAPQPPPILIHPPPPPPLPNAVTTRTKIGLHQTMHSREDLESKPPSVTRAVECCESRTGYEKNIHPLEKWRNCRSIGDIRIDEEDENMGNRTTIFDSKKTSEKQNRLSSYLPSNPDPFQKEIQAVTKKIAENRQKIEPSNQISLKNNKDNVKTNFVSENISNAKLKEIASPPKFYFADVDVFKNLPPTKIESNNSKHKSSSTVDVLSKTDSSKDFSSKYLSTERTTIDEVVPSLERFSPTRRRLKSSNSPSRSSTSSTQDKIEKEWDNMSKNLCKKTEGFPEFDIRLRPVLPRKQTEVPKFLPSEAWQALGSDGLGSSNHSTSDDGPEFAQYNDGIVSRNRIIERNKRISEMYENKSSEFSKRRNNGTNHWTPKQDLIDDSDLSEDSDDAVIPRMRADQGEISTRFGLPTVMFSNMRPIGSDFIKTNSTYVNGSAKSKQSKKKMANISQPFYENNTSTSFKKFLNKRNKYLSEEDLAVSDSNWTFGQYGLQKRGKQYSSELVLSDKKRHELNNNFSDFLEDILTTKANHMQKQMKSSDSGNSNFSFYSTEGVMYMPNQNGFAHEECSPPTKGRVYHMRRKFDPNIRAQTNNPMTNSKKISASDMDLGRRRDLELAKMLEDEVRKRRNKEKISIRQELHRMKNLRMDEDFDDEAYFTEPKSREDSHSPLYPIQDGLRPSRYRQKSLGDSSQLSHWQSSPAIFEDSAANKDIRPTNKVGHRSTSSIMSSPSPDAWKQKNANVDNWLQRYGRTKVEDAKRHVERDIVNDGDVSSSPTPVPTKKKERRKTNIYKQLMDIVRKEERHLKNAQRTGSNPKSCESSYSIRESSPSLCSEASSISSCSYSDSSGSKNQGVSANQEFHSSHYNKGAVPAAFAQPYSPSKSYRPVAFDAAAPYRMMQHRDGQSIQAGVS